MPSVDELRADKDFMSATAADQQAYLKSTDPDFAKASSSDQNAYIDHLRTVPEKAASFSDVALGNREASEMPLTSYPAATERGIAGVLGGVSKAVKGIPSMLEHPVETAKQLYSLPGQATEVPGAIRDIKAAPGGTERLLGVAEKTAGEGAGQAILGAAAEGAAEVAPKVIENAPKVIPTLLRDETTWRMPGRELSTAPTPRAIPEPLGGRATALGTRGIPKMEPAGALRHLPVTEAKSAAATGEALGTHGIPKMQMQGVAIPENLANDIGTVVKSEALGRIKAPAALSEEPSAALGHMRVPDQPITPEAVDQARTETPEMKTSVQEPVKSESDPKESRYRELSPSEQRALEYRVGKRAAVDDSPTGMERAAKFMKATNQDLADFANEHGPSKPGKPAEGEVEPQWTASDFSRSRQAGKGLPVNKQWVFDHIMDNLSHPEFLKASESWGRKAAPASSEYDTLVNKALQAEEGRAWTSQNSKALMDSLGKEGIDADLVGSVSKGGKSANDLDITIKGDRSSLPRALQEHGFKFSHNTPHGAVWTNDLTGKAIDLWYEAEEAIPNRR